MINKFYSKIYLFILIQHWQLFCKHMSVKYGATPLLLLKLVLTDTFRFIKKVEHSWKALVHDGVRSFTSSLTPAGFYVQLHEWMFLYRCVSLTGFFVFQDTVSVHRPSFYADRFLKFMGSTVFKKLHRKFDWHELLCSVSCVNSQILTLSVVVSQL